MNRQKSQLDVNYESPFDEKCSRNRNNEISKSIAISSYFDNKKNTIFKSQNFSKNDKNENIFEEKYKVSEGK